MTVSVLFEFREKNSGAEACVQEVCIQGVEIFVFKPGKKESFQLHKQFAGCISVIGGGN